MGSKLLGSEGYMATLGENLETKSVGDWENFVISSFWEDFENHLKCRFDFLVGQLRQSTPEAVAQIQGALDEVELLIGIPESMIEVLKQFDEDKEEGEGDHGNTE